MTNVQPYFSAYSYTPRQLEAAKSVPSILEEERILRTGIRLGLEAARMEVTNFLYTTTTPFDVYTLIDHTYATYMSQKSRPNKY